MGKEVTFRLFGKSSTPYRVVKYLDAIPYFSQTGLPIRVRRSPYMYSKNRQYSNFAL